jgi:hypothetical protein
MLVPRRKEKKKKQQEINNIPLGKNKITELEAKNTEAKKKPDYI